VGYFVREVDAGKALLSAVYWSQNRGNAIRPLWGIAGRSVRRLAPDRAAELSALAERLALLTPNGTIDSSDSWSDDDLRDFRAASLKRTDAQDAEDLH
jgi:hypothetical protein